MPVAIGYIASYLLKNSDSENTEVRLYDDPDYMIKDIKEWRPEVIGLSNFCWNSELTSLVFRYAKRLNPNTVCIAGGAEFPTDHAECEKYLSERKEMDFYVYLEGEIAFAGLIQKLQSGMNLSSLKSSPQDGVMSLHPQTGALIVGEPLSRPMNLDIIPSPYLNGLMDQWFDGYHAPSIETARGCPFSCGFCYMGKNWFREVARFSIGRIKEELIYIAQRMKGYPNIVLSLCDSNFGMYERDEEIAKHLKELQDKFGWPQAYDVTTGKANYDRILRIASLLDNHMYVTCSVQSLNPETLEVIKRKNLPMDEYKQVQEEIKKRGMPSSVELIFPMPEETKASYFKGVETLLNAGVGTVVPYTTMFLKGTYLASQECRKKYEMKSKFRILPRQIGEYLGEKCFEIEEVCVETNTMSFQDYMECRGFSLITAIFCYKQFDVIRRHLKELKISVFDYLYYFWELVKSGKTELSENYNRYIEETREELWDSKKELYEYFVKPEAYQKLLKGKLGDNLIRKYCAKIFLENCISSIELAYFVILNIKSTNLTSKIQDSLDAAKRWMIACRNISNTIREDFFSAKDEILHLPYNVPGWYNSVSQSKPLTSYETSSNFRIFYEPEQLKAIMDEGKKLYGTEDANFLFGKLLIHWSVSNFWRKCEELKNSKNEKQ